MKVNNSFVKVLLGAFLIQVLFLSISCAQVENKHEEEGEESGTRYAKNEKCEEVRKGIQLQLAYDEATSAFVGTVENISDQLVKKVRVEVHLSNGTELGPTKSINLEPGKKAEVKLSAKDQDFKWWSTHAESGSSEHSHGEHGEHGEGGDHN